MKRKRGNKKSKGKKPSSTSVPNEESLNVTSVPLNTEDNSGPDDDDMDNDVDLDPTPSHHNHHLNPGNDKNAVNPNNNDDEPVVVEKKVVHAVYGRVKVKLKTSKLVDAPLMQQSDNDKSSPQIIDLEKPILTTEKIPETKISNLSSTAGPGSIKIKSSKSFGSSSGVNQIPKPVLKMPSHQSSTHKKQELDDSITVIKKVMKMDAAEPFNTPVNPTALGIPDYFDVIKTPMDFGTICNNLEKGLKYTNSEDVFKDVQYIWENCYKYNNKGDYIVDLMKRVKKNFIKYWTAAGLYNENAQNINGTESIQEDNAAASGQGHMKHKKGKRHGMKRHKDGCLCAVCILKRRRKEREENAKIVEDDRANLREVKPVLDLKKQEVEEDGSAPMEEEEEEDSSSNMEDHEESGPDESNDRRVGKQELKSEADLHHNQNHHSPMMKNEIENPIKVNEEQTPQQSPMDEEDSGGGGDGGGGDTSVQEKEQSAVAQQHNKSQEEDSKEGKPKKDKNFYENLDRFENPMILKLCETLFPENHPKSVWSGPHSLLRVLQKERKKTSLLHAAIQTFMN